MNKAEVMKLQAGTWVETKWDDEPNAVGLLLDKPDRGSGDISLHIWWPDLNTDDYHAIHSQVVRSLGGLVVPTI